MKSIFFKLFMLINLTVYAQFQENIIETDPYHVNSIILADIDNDSDNDIIVSGGENNQLKWLENTDGLGNFNIVHGIMEYNFPLIGKEIAISDIDSDNDADILVSTSEQDCGEIRTFRNTDGLGNFEGFTSSMSTCGLQSEIEVGDIDGDNYFDWASSVSASQFNEAKFSWFKNNGDGIVTEQVIDDSYVRSFRLIDIDNDNDLDFAGFNLYTPNNSQVFWYENTDGLGNYEKNPINNNPNLNYYSKLIIADLDHDNDFDIITAYDNILSWHKNDGLGNFGPETIIHNNSFTKRNILAIDLDSDGFVDIVSTGDNNLVNYYKNDGLGNFTRLIIIDNMYRTNSPLFAEDVNGDNKIDIIASSSENGKIAWYKNSGVLSANQNSALDFTIYPNPSKNIININSKTDISHIKIYNPLGISVLYIKNTTKIDISNLSTGIYFIEVIDIDGSTGLKKIIKE